MFWLEEWLNIKFNTYLFEKMNMSGLEIESINKVSENFFGVIIGEIIEYKNLININKKNIYIMKINIGKKNTLNIVSHKKNCFIGLKVAIATIGVHLPGYKESIKLKKFHNYFSEGKLCSFSDLGINKNNELIIFPQDALIGEEVYNYLKLSDLSFTINIHFNRYDCFSILGLTREISAISKIKLSKRLDSISKNVKNTINSIIPIYIKEKKYCPIYLGRIIKNINSNIYTPLWILEKLRRSGIISINIIIDIINYVLLEIGQPIYIYDYDNIDKNIIVRFSKKNEKFIDHNNKKILYLDEDVLVVSDRKKILSLMGISDNQYCYNISNIKNIFIQSAFVDPNIILGKSKKYGINSNFKLYFERGIDSSIQKISIERITNLILRICGGDAGPIINITDFNNIPKRSYIQLNKIKIKKLLGYNILENKITDIFKRLGYKIKYNKNSYFIKPPVWRYDILISEDLIEELIRIDGYHNVPINISKKNHLSNKNLKFYKKNYKINFLDRAKLILINRNYQEVINYSFVSANLQNLLYPKIPSLSLPNPISEDMSVMRTSLWNGLLSVLLYNKSYQKNNLRIFESGICFIPNKKNNDIKEELRLSGLLSGNLYHNHWNLKNKKIDFYDLKGDIESVLDLTNQLENIEFRAQNKLLILHPGKSAVIYLNNKKIGLIGVLHPKISKILKISYTTLLFELYWEKITFIKNVKIKKVSKFPINRRDISIIIRKNIPVFNILKECKKILENNLLNINIFDIYEGNNINKNYKSISISFNIQGFYKNLEEKEINNIINKYILMLKEKFQATLRE